MTTFTIDGMEVWDGDGVPLTGDNGRGVLVLWRGSAFVYYRDGRIFAITNTGQPLLRSINVAVDTCKMKAERAPKVEAVRAVGGWTVSIPDGRRDVATLTAKRYDADNHYWTCRPGNDPEKQTEFDAALDDFVRHAWSPGTACERLANAARSLGYGGNK